LVFDAMWGVGDPVVMLMGPWKEAERKENKEL
jgi:hypothetical protein